MEKSPILNYIALLLLGTCILRVIGKLWVASELFEVWEGTVEPPWLKDDLVTHSVVSLQGLTA
jgi:hypothetical protein